MKSLGRVPLKEWSSLPDEKTMSLFQWTDDLALSHVLIDGQHQRLFQFADALAEAMSAGKGQEVLDRTLSDLITYTKQHFLWEEALMQANGYPHFEEHKDAHDALTEEVEGFQKAYAAGEAVITVDLLIFLQKWLSHHIGEADRQVAVYLKENQPLCGRPPAYVQPSGDPVPPLLSI